MSGATVARRLTLVRHGRAEQKGSGQRDFDRALDRRGLAEATGMAHRWRDSGLPPDLLVASAALRTVQTAEAFQRVLARPARPLRIEPSLYLAEVAALLECIRATDDEVAHLMLIGHNPGLSDLAVQLAPSARFAGFDTGASCSMEFAAVSWSVLQLGQAQDFRYEAPGRFHDAWS